MATTKTVDSSLWWDPFTDLLTELETASVSSDLPPKLVKKLEENRSWLVETVSRFKPPNEKSKEALNSQIVKVGDHQLSIKHDLKDQALKISSKLCLDEVQSYILVERSQKQHNVAIDSIVSESIHVILLQYYIERQCLLKCTRRIFMHALYIRGGSKEANAVSTEALKLISDGLESKLISVLQDLLSSTHPVEMDIDLFILWAEETLIEDSLVLDILFLLYYESFCTCNGEKWKKLCSLYKGILSGSYNFGKLAISSEALKSSFDAKIQLLLILIETLDLENLLQMVHDETPFSQGTLVFSLNDIQEMDDALLSTLDTFEMKEAGPLLLAWAVFLCLISSLPRKEDTNVLMGIDHVGYVCQAFEAETLNSFLEILQSDLLQESEGPVAGYRSVLRTFFSAFIASYEINLQLEDSTLNLILHILCRIYRGEESLCSQFWDKESFVDGPIRCFLSNLEGEFPFRTVELVRFLSSLAEGSWPAECVYNFLNKSVGISTLFEISNETLVDSKIVETAQPLHVLGVEGLLIPSKIQGHVLRVFGGNTALVRWEYNQSAVLVLLLRLARDPYPESNMEAFLILDLFSRMVSFNMAIRFALMNIGNSLYVQGMGLNEQIEKNVWVAEIICTLIRDLSPNSSSAAIMSMGVNILAKMLKCSPAVVTAVALKTNIFDVASRGSIIDIGSNGSTSGRLLSGKLARMLLIDSEQNDYDCPLTISVLEFTMQLVETGLENDFVLTLVVFALQYVLVNHEYWKYKVKNVRWKVTLKVLEVMKTCIISTSSSGKLGEVIGGMLLCDSSIHNTLCRIICTTKEALEKLYVIRTFDLMEIEGLQLAIASVLDILYTILSKFSKEMSSILPVFHRAVLSSTSTPIPVVGAVMSLISYFRYPAIQVGATRVLSMLLTVSDYSQPCLSGNACFGLDDKQIADLRHSVDCMLQSVENEDLFIASINLLTSAAQHQPAFLIALFSTKESVDIRQSIDYGKKHPANDALKGPQGLNTPSMVVTLLLYVERYGDLINSNPRVLLNVLNFLKALWQAAGQYADILEWLKSSGKSWKQLSNSFSLNTSLQASELENMTEMESQSLAYKYQCQSAILEIMAHDMFLKQSLLHAESLVKQVAESKGGIENTASAGQTKSANDFDFKEILSNWFQRSVLGTLIKSYTTCAYDNEILFRAKAAVSLLTVHLIGKLETGDAGSLSVSLLEKVRLMSKKLTSQAAFSQLLLQYSQRRYSEGKELKTLILSDLYCHLQGEFEGRKISPGAFRELSQYLIESKFLQSYEHKYAGDQFAITKDVYMFDPVCVRADLGLDMWDYLEWGASKVIADTMLHCMQEANSMLFLATSKLSALKALVTVLTVYEDDSLERRIRIGVNVPDQLSHFDQICQNFHATVELLAPSLDAPKDILDFLAAQAELLLHHVRSVQKRLSLSVCVLVLKTSVFGLKVLSDLRVSAAGVNITIKHLLMLLLSVMESTCLNSLRDRVKDNESVGDLAEVSNMTLGLLPILCHCITNTEHCTLSLIVVDLVMRSLLTPNTWFPIIQQHLQLCQVIHKLQDKNSFPSISTILKFFLTLARFRGGAEMLLNAGFFSSLRVLLSELLDGGPSSVVSNDKTPFNVPDKTEKLHLIWGLGLAVVAAMVHSLGDSYCTDIVNNVIPYFFSEKAYLISYYLNAPEFPSDHHDKKRPRAQRTQTSLTSLKETEHTLMLMCVLAKHWSLWVKAMNEMDSQLREASIHLLAFISRGTHRIGESASRMAALLCPPILKEELDWFKKPSVVNSKNGWFSLTPLGCGSKTKFSAASATIVRGQTTESSHPVSQTYFSDVVAVQMYRIAFLLLKFLCLQAKGAAERAEEVGFVDLAHFPELPMPEILHGLQDQVIAIVTELCEVNKSKQIDPEIRRLCLLLLQVMEMALNLELCVVQICGIRPVLGRVEDFSREVKLLIKATERHVFLKVSMKSLEHTISIFYPGLL